jgi:hypothetical protein
MKRALSKWYWLARVPARVTTVFGKSLSVMMAASFALAFAAVDVLHAQGEMPDDDARLKALTRLPGSFDASPLPKYKGDFVSIDAAGNWHRAPDNPAVVYGSTAGSTDVKQDCSPEAIIHYATRAPSEFDYEKKGLLYGVRTHTPATRLITRYWDMPGFNSCALVVYAILKKAGCGWAKHTANAKAIYDMAYRAGWKPTRSQRGGCMVAWNSRWEGDRARIGTRQKQTKNGSTAFRHVGITTGSWLSVDNSSWRSRPTRYLTFRPIVYEAPFFLCPPGKS